jgi:hypothetical protein
LDQETIDGHRIYFPDNRTIQVEWSVKFPEAKRSGGIFKVLNEGENAEIKDEENRKIIQHIPSTTPQTPITPSHTLDSPLTMPPTIPVALHHSERETIPI